MLFLTQIYLRLIMHYELMNYDKDDYFCTSISSLPSEVSLSYILVLNFLSIRNLGNLLCVSIIL
jgi:hypothetical protein